MTWVRAAAIAALLAASYAPGARAQNSSVSFAATCSNLTGYTYSLRDGLPSDLRGFQRDGITGGRILILIGKENGPGGAEVKFRDATGQFLSATADGAAVTFLGFNEQNRVAQVEARYRVSGTVETYTLKFVSATDTTLLMTAVRPSGAAPKVSVFSGVCETY